MTNLAFHLANSVQVSKRFLFPEHLARHRWTEKKGTEQVNKPIHGEKKKENLKKRDEKIMTDLGSQKSPHYAQKLKMTQSYLELEGKMYSSCRNWPF